MRESMEASFTNAQLVSACRLAHRGCRGCSVIFRGTNATLWPRNGQNRRLRGAEELKDGFEGDAAGRGSKAFLVCRCLT